MDERANQEMTENESQTFLKNVRDVISDPKELYSCVRNGESFEIVGLLAWELISDIVTYLKDNAVSDNLLLYGKSISEIARLSVPKDLYLGILEHFDPCMESKYVELLIPALASTIKKLLLEDLDATAMVLETTFSTLSYYLESLNLPNYDDYNPSEKRKESYEATKIFTMMEKFILCLKPAIEKVCLNRKDIHSFGRLRAHTFEFLCSLLVILAQLDLSVPDPSKIDDLTATKEKVAILNPSGVSLLCCDIMKLTAMFFTPFSLWTTANWLQFHPVEEISPEGRMEMAKKVERGQACFLYLLLCREVLYEHFPKVYSHMWMLVRTMPSVNALLLCKSQAVVWKGLEMLRYVLEQTQHSTISYREILYSVRSQIKCGLNAENIVHKLFQELTNIAVTLPSKTIRRKAVELIVSFLDVFLWEDKYTLLVHLLRVSQHAGVNGMLVGYLKDKLHQILRDSPPKDSASFCDKRKMATLGELIFLLPDGTETDLLDDSDRLLPALNLLRFILIRDKVNTTGIFDNIAKIDKLFLTPLRSALDLSRAHYQKELHMYGKSAQRKEGATDAFYVRGTPLASIPSNEQKKILIGALHTFDTIEVVTIRVLELIDENKHMHNEPKAC